MRGPGLIFENSLGPDAHSALPSPKGVTVRREMMRVVAPLPRMKECERLDRCRRTLGKSPLVERCCAEWSSDLPSDDAQSGEHSMRD